MSPHMRMAAIFVTPYVGVMLFAAPLGVLHGVYAKYFEIPMTAIATVLFVSRLFDAINDPVVGYYSDRERLRIGTRKPFIFVGGLLVAVSCFFLYIPPDDVGLVYFTTWSLLFYLALTLFDIPYTAWASELSHSADEKKMIFSFKGGAAVLGSLTFYLIPLLPLFDSQEITPETLRVTAFVGLSLLIPGIFIVLRWIPSPEAVNVTHAEKVSVKEDLVAALRSMRKNKPFLAIIVSKLLVGMSSSTWYGLIFIYVDSYLKKGDLFAKVFLITMCLGLLAIPLWHRVSRWIGKRNTCLIGSVMVLISYVYTGLLDPSNTTFTHLLILKTIQSYGFIAFTVLYPAMVGECIDYGTLKEGTERSASYYSIYVFSQKTIIAVGTATGLAIAGWFGYAPDLQENTASSIAGLTFAIAWLPLIFGTVGTLALATFSLTERKHSLIRKRLDALSLRSAQAEESGSNKNDNLDSSKADSQQTSSPV